MSLYYAAYSLYSNYPILFVGYGWYSNYTKGRYIYDIITYTNDKIKRFMYPEKLDEWESVENITVVDRTETSVIFTDCIENNFVYLNFIKPEPRSIEL